MLFLFTSNYKVIPHQVYCDGNFVYGKLMTQVVLLYQILCPFNVNNLRSILYVYTNAIMKFMHETYLFQRYCYVYYI